MPDTGLKSSPAVMAWRRVSDLKAADNFAARVAGFPKVGSNKYANIYDGGNALVGYWVQEKLAEVVKREQGVSEARLASLSAELANCCSRNFDKMALVSNPANQLIVGAGDFQGAVNRLGRTFKVSPSVNKTTTGDTVSFVDQDGNFSGIFRPGAGLRRSVASKFRTLLKQKGSGGRGAKRGKSRGSVVGFELLVSDLKASQQFYKNVLGLRSLGAGRDHVQFDLGSLVLTIKVEPALGLVQSLQRFKRLEGDWLMFHVDDIDDAVKALKGRGVKFPLGIEESAHGRGALFQDPDGHVLNVWEPPPALGNVEREKSRRAARGKRLPKRGTNDIDYFPALHRILQQSA